MKSARSRRKYRSSLEFVETAMRACLQNAHDLVAGSKALIGAKLDAPGLALTVLALEELGKLLTIDGLLFATADDRKSKHFRTSSYSHGWKLQAFELFPLFVYAVSKHDPRFGSDKQFAATLAIGLRDWQDSCNTIVKTLNARSLSELDSTKQKALYSHELNSGFVAPRDIIETSFSDAVYHLAWRTLDTLDFALSGENLSRYIDWARSLRSQLSEEEHEEFERLGKMAAVVIFGEVPDESDRVH